MSPLERLVHAARHGQIVLSKHCIDERMPERNVRRDDIRHAFTTATHADASSDKPDVWLVRGGKDRQGDALLLVVREIQIGVFVITIY